MTDELQKLVEILRESKRIVFFGGAGVSTESGIPDFRSANGLWNEKLKMELEEATAFSAGDPEFLTKLYDLSLILPEEALVTSFRFNDGNCELGIQTQNRNIDFSQRLRFPYWRISRLQERIVSTNLFSFTLFFVKTEVQPPFTSSLKPQLEDQIQTIVLLNIFAPRRAPTASSIRSRITSGNNRDMTLVGTFVIGEISGATIILHNRATQVTRNNLNGTINSTGEFATAQKQQLQQALENRAELNKLLQTLQQTEGVTDEQTALLRQRLERSNKQVELLQNQQKNIGQDGLSANGSTATANASNSDKHYVRIGETLPNGFMLQAVTRTSATLVRGDEVVELTLQDNSTP